MAKSNNTTYGDYDDELKANYSSIESRKKQGLTIIEYFFIFVLTVIIFIITYESNYKEILKSGNPMKGHFVQDIIFQMNMLYGFIPVCFTVLYKLIFDVTPIQHLRYINSPLYKAESTSFPIDPGPLDLHDTDIISATNNAHRLVDQSQKLAKNIYTRAGVYILVGSIIGIFGLLYFSYNLKPEINPNSLKSSPLLEPISAYLPRLGAFIFLEFLAFFFLKQHKGMMDEFRYYEGIQRAREEKVFYLNLLTGDENKAKLLEMLKGIDRSDVLTAGNSSIILESKKLEKDDFEILNKIVDKIKP